MHPSLLALDFDGVICDGLLEYFETAWKAYCEVFQPASTEPPAGLAERFYPLRPVVESGWEMPLVLYGLLTGVGDGRILDHWPNLVIQLLTQAKIEAATLGAAVDRVRDRWIEADLEGWLGLHRFYPGVVPRLQQMIDQGVPLVIISTKEGRFIEQLLATEGLTLPSKAIFGKEIKRPKYETLRYLKTVYGSGPIWFVEDRIAALQAVESQFDLEDVGLFLADWGYNTITHRASARRNPHIHLLSLEQFSGPFTSW